MSNPTCLWCGEETVHANGGRFACDGEHCVASTIDVTKEMLEQYPVPCELQVWEVEYTFQPHASSVTTVATWLGLFASEKLAMGAGKKAFDGISGAVFEWEAKPVVFEFKGGVK